METTSIFVELLVAGCSSLSWMLLLCLRLSVLDVATLHSLFAFDDAKSEIFVGLGVVIAYQVGMMVNLLAYGILYAVQEKTWQSEAVGPADSFEEMRAIVSLSLIRHGIFPDLADAGKSILQANGYRVQGHSQGRSSFARVY